MPAANLIELYNFEGNVEAAFKSWLADNQVELYQTIEFDILPDDYIGAKLELGSVTGHYNPAPGGAATPEYDQYACSLEITIRTARFDESGAVTSAAIKAPSTDCRDADLAQYIAGQGIRT